MSIMWKYLDKRTAAIAAIKDRRSMQFIIEHTGEDIAAERDRMTSSGAVRMNGLPHAPNPKAGEDRIISSIEEIDVLKERYRQAVEYMDWFEPAWAQLSKDEQYILETFYNENPYGTNAAWYIADHYQIEQASAYRKKNRALDHLTVLLFGKA